MNVPRRIPKHHKDGVHPIGAYGKKDHVGIGAAEIALFAFLIIGILVTALAYYYVSRPAGLTYEMVGGEVHIIDYEGNDVSLVIPATREGRPVTRIREGVFEGNAAIESVTLGENLRTIDDRAFKDMENLDTVHLEDETALLEVGTDVFSGTPFDAAQDDDMFAFVGRVLYRVNEAHVDRNVSIPEETLAIAKEAFYDIDTIESVTFNPGLLFIGERAFARMNSLNVLSFETTIDLLVISREAFAYNAMLETIEAPIESPIERIGSDAFKDTPWRAMQDPEFYHFGNIRVEESRID